MLVNILGNYSIYLHQFIPAFYFFMEKINVKRHPRVLQEKRLHAMMKSDPQYEYIYLASYSLCIIQCTFDML